MFAGRANQLTLDFQSTISAPDWMTGVNIKPEVRGDAIHRYHKLGGRIVTLAKIDSPAVDTPTNWYRLFEMAERYGLPMKVIGGASNLMFTENGFNGLMVKYFYRGPYPKPEIDRDAGVIRCSAAIPLSLLVKEAAKSGFQMADLSGIPGTVGGALFNNSGNSKTGVNIGDFVQSVEILDGAMRRSFTLTRDQMGFVQRGNKLLGEFTTRHNVLRAVELVPPQGEPAETRSEWEVAVRYRAAKNRWAKTNAGSFWVNKIPNQMGDGVLTRDFILTSELAGLDIGGAHYVPQYAFLETGSQTTDQDLATLMLKSLMLLRSRFSGHSRVEVEFIDGRSSIEPFEFIRRYFPWQRDLYEDLSDANSTGRA